MFSGQVSTIVAPLVDEYARCAPCNFQVSGLRLWMHPNRVLADDGVGPVGCTLTVGVRLLAAPTNGVANALATWAATGWPSCVNATCVNGSGIYLQLVCFVAAPKIC